MKTIKLLALLFVSGLLTLSCGGEPQTSDHEEEPLAAPNSIITVQEAEALFTNYKNNRIPLIEEAQNIGENGEPLNPNDDNYLRATSSLSLTYSELQDYMKFIEQQAEKANTPITGLRIYFGQYGPKTGKYPNAETVFLNPLMKYSGSTGDITHDVAFAIQDIGGNPTAVPVGDIIKGKSNQKGGTNLEMIIQGSVQSLAGNDMPRRPPPPLPNNPDYN